MEKILSIVIPSYNVEKYLEQTLESFVDAAVLQDIEVLIVDDDSKDSAPEMGKRYESQYPGNFRLISKQNGSHGSTINRGIQECIGKYFKVVDGDDWVNTKDFITLIENLKSCDADYVVTNYYEVNDPTGVKTAKTDNDLRNETTGNCWSFCKMEKLAQPFMHALIFRSSILKNNHICLDEHSFYVDVEYILYPFPFVDSIIYFDLFVYMYRLAQATQSVSMA